MDLYNLDFQTLLILCLAFALGGLVKGATGAGSPVIAIPVLAVFIDAKLAVALMAIPNLFSNLIQIHQYKDTKKSPKLAFNLAVFGTLGCLFGTIFFVSTSTRTIELVVALVTILYVISSITGNSAKLSVQIAKSVAPAIGIVGGIVQGTCGVSAPIALGFLNSLQISRNEFIFTISCFFGAMAGIQIISLLALNFVDWQLFLIAIFSMVPLSLGMPLGNHLTKRLSKKSFERLILFFLIILSTNIILSP